MIVIQINSDWRIVSDPLQWIVQRRRTVKGKDKWDSRTFHSDLGNAVMRLASAHIRTFDAVVGPDALEVLCHFLDSLENKFLSAIGEAGIENAARRLHVEDGTEKDDDGEISI